MSTKNSSRFTPVIIAVSVVVGILIGTFYAKHFAGNRLGIINGSSNKLNALLRIVAVSYTHLIPLAKFFPCIFLSAVRSSCRESGILQNFL